MRLKLLARVALALLLAQWATLANTRATADFVTFNIESKKYHCLDCKWAIKCTRNCLEITRWEAHHRHGTACKVCGGTCQPTELRARPYRPS